MRVLCELHKNDIEISWVFMHTYFCIQRLHKSKGFHMIFVEWVGAQLVEKRRDESLCGKNGKIG